MPVELIILSAIFIIGAFLFFAAIVASIAAIIQMIIWKLTRSKFLLVIIPVLSFIFVVAGGDGLDRLLLNIPIFIGSTIAGIILAKKEPWDGL